MNFIKPSWSESIFLIQLVSKFFFQYFILHSYPLLLVWIPFAIEHHWTFNEEHNKKITFQSSYHHSWTNSFPFKMHVYNYSCDISHPLLVVLILYLSFSNFINVYYFCPHFLAMAQTFHCVLSLFRLLKSSLFSLLLYFLSSLSVQALLSVFWRIS